MLTYFHIVVLSTDTLLYQYVISNYRMIKKTVGYVQTLTSIESALSFRPVPCFRARQLLLRVDQLLLRLWLWRQGLASGLFFPAASRREVWVFLDPAANKQSTGTTLEHALVRRYCIASTGHRKYKLQNEVLRWDSKSAIQHYLSDVCWKQQANFCPPLTRMLVESGSLSGECSQRHQRLATYRWRSVRGWPFNSHSFQTVLWKTNNRQNANDYQRCNWLQSLQSRAHTDYYGMRFAVSFGS